MLWPSKQTSGSLNLGSPQSKSWFKVEDGAEAERICKMVGMCLQGAWMRWEGALEEKISWTEIWQEDHQRIKFLVWAVYDVLPSLANLHIWGRNDSPACHLCPGRSSLGHILSNGPKDLGEGRYRWQHDQVLKSIAESISKAMANNKYGCYQRNITFVRSGEQPHSQPKPAAGLFTSALDWELQVDLGRQLKFPVHIVATALRPDMVLTSATLKHVLLIELTVPWEDCIK